MQEYELLYLLRRLNAAMEHAGQERFARLGLNQTQGAVLYLLLVQDGDPLCAIDLHHTLGLSRASLSTLLRGLREEGYLALAVDAKDERRRRLYPTEKARKLEPALREALRAQQACAADALPRKETERVTRDLHNILDYMEQERKKGGNQLC